MRAYLVTATIPSKEGEDTPFKKYAGNQTDAATIKRELFETHRDAGLKRGSIEVEEVEIPTSKAELVAWANENAVG